LMIVGWSRANEARGAGAGGSAVAYSLLGALATIGFVSVVVFGVAVIINK
jgi:hypothetical protein